MAACRYVASLFRANSSGKNVVYKKIQRLTMQRTKIHRNILIISFVALVSGFGQDLITPILPSFLIAIGVGHAGIGTIDGLL